MPDASVNVALQVFAAGFLFALLFQLFAGMLFAVIRTVRETMGLGR